MDNTDNDVESLGTIFKQGLDLFNNLGRDDEPTNSPNVQVKKRFFAFGDTTFIICICICIKKYLIYVVNLLFILFD